MQINTSYEISEMLSDKLTRTNSIIGYDIYSCKRWVRVEDIIKIFDDDSITSFEDLKDYIDTNLKNIKSEKN